MLGIGALVSRKLVPVVAILLFLATRGPQAAQDVPIGGPWNEFSFSTAGVQATGCFPDDPNGIDCVQSSAGNSVFAGPPPWTFTSTDNVNLTVTDAFLRGDTFKVFDGGVFVGLTPGVAAQGGCDSDPAVCVADPLVSHATFTLAAGAHSITITPFAVTNPGAAYFRLDAAPTPTPSPTPTPTPIPTPTPTPKPTPSPTPLPSPTPAPTPFPTPIPSPTPIAKPGGLR
ncbi:MAG TPA: hypothetical protein VHA33_01155 [Candidatus Angelobacter sp.]|jgi:hypothetical protein|nr:hypothetical protein [Candidatus Angelobacter sp.]